MDGGCGVPTPRGANRYRQRSVGASAVCFPLPAVLAPTVGRARAPRELGGRGLRCRSVSVRLPLVEEPAHHGAPVPCEARRRSRRGFARRVAHVLDARGHTRTGATGCSIAGGDVVLSDSFRERRGCDQPLYRHGYPRALARQQSPDGLSGPDRFPMGSCRAAAAYPRDRQSPLPRPGDVRCRSIGCTCGRGCGGGRRRVFSYRRIKRAGSLSGST